MGIDVLNIWTSRAWLQNTTVQLTGNNNSPGLARDALVLGPSIIFIANFTKTASVSNTIQAGQQPSLSQQPSNMHMASY